MKLIKNYGKLLIINLSLIIGSSLIIAILYYFELIGPAVISIINMIIGIIIFLYSGIYIGKRSERKGYLQGLKIGIILILLMFLISILMFKFKINLSTILYYLVLIASSIFGSMIGINKSEKKVS